MSLVVSGAFRHPLGLAKPFFHCEELERSKQNLGKDACQTLRMVPVGGLEQSACYAILSDPLGWEGETPWYGVARWRLDFSGGMVKLLASLDSSCLRFVQTKPILYSGHWGCTSYTRRWVGALKIDQWASKRIIGSLERFGKPWRLRKLMESDWGICLILPCLKAQIALAQVEKLKNRNSGPSWLATTFALRDCPRKCSSLSQIPQTREFTSKCSILRRREERARERGPESQNQRFSQKR